MDISRVQFTVPVSQQALEQHAAQTVGSLENISLNNVETMVSCANGCGE